MLKKIVCILVMLFLLPLSAGAEENIVVNRLKNRTLEAPFSSEAELLHIWFPHISGCDGAVLKCGGQVALIDACTPDQAKGALMELLTGLHITHVDYVINSHPDPDHMGGIRVLLQNGITIGKIITGFPQTGFENDENQRMQDLIYRWASEYDVPVERMGDGDTLDLGCAVIRMLQCIDDSVYGVNNASMMCMVSLNERRAFFAADIQLATQKKLLADSYDIAADILKFSHHGYRGANEEYLKKISPLVTVLTGGVNGTTASQCQLAELHFYYTTTEYFTLHLATDGNQWLLESLN